MALFISHESKTTLRSASSTFSFAASIFDSIPSSSSSSSSSLCVRSLCFSHRRSTTHKQSFSFPSVKECRFPPSLSTERFITRAAEYKFPDPIPEFADAEMEKFRNHLLKKLLKKDMYGGSVNEVVGVCTEGGASSSSSGFMSMGSIFWNFYFSNTDVAEAPKVVDGENPYIKEMFLRGRKYYPYVHRFPSNSGF